MGTAITTLQKAGQTTLSNPGIIALTLGVTLLGFLFAFVFSFIPIIGQFLAAATYATLIVGLLGVIGTTITNTNTNTTKSKTTTYQETIKDRGKSAFGVGFLENLLYFVFMFVLLVIGLIIFAFTDAIYTLDSTPQSVDQTTGFITGLDITVLLFALIAFGSYIALIITFQFLTPSIALGNKNAVSAFTTSFNIVKTHPVSVLGYSLIRFGLYIIFAAISIAVFILTTAALGDTGLIVSIPVIVLVSIITTTLFYAYHAHYYIALDSTTINLPPTPETDGENKSSTESEVDIDGVSEPTDQVEEADVEEEQSSENETDSVFNHDNNIKDE